MLPERAQVLFRFLVVPKARLQKQDSFSFCESNAVGPFINVLQCKIAHDPGMLGAKQS